MRRAPENGEECHKTLLDTVATALRQRLGKDRMELWFGSGTRWSLADTHTIGIEVSSEFLANCINTMFRGDLQGVIAQCAGPDWGCVVTPKRRGKSPFLDSGTPAEGEIAYDRDSAAGATVAPTESQTEPTLVATTVTAIPALPSSAPSADASAASQDSLRGETVGAGVGLRVVRSESPDAEAERLVSMRKQNETRWEDFISGDHNRLAYTAAQMVLERPGQVSPFLLYGPHGVGKSHLASALAQRLRQQYRMRRVLTLTGEQFTIEYTESARGGGFANFRRKYRDVEALVIDDVHFCLGKSGTLAELRNTIDMLLRERRQVILVADRGLNELMGLGTDLYARLSGGMCCGIDPVDVLTREKLLQRICGRHEVQIADDVLHELATQCGGDARILQGIVHRLVAQQRLQNSPLTKDDAFRCTGDLVRASQPVVRLNDIERVVCEAFGLQDEMLRAKTKCQSVSQPRMLAMFLARKYTRTALSEIGEYFGKRQHSTVISAQRKVEEWLSSNDSIAFGRNKVQVRDILKNLESTLQVG
jgi:chromosomal replication initiator protein